MQNTIQKRGFRWFAAVRVLRLRLYCLLYLACSEHDRKFSTWLWDVAAYPNLFGIKGYIVVVGGGCGMWLETESEAA